MKSCSPPRPPTPGRGGCAGERGGPVGTGRPPVSAGLWSGTRPPHRPWWERMMKADGTPYRAGEIFRWPEYADTLEELAATSCESFYRGEPDGADGLLQPGDGGLFSRSRISRTTARSGWSPSPRTTRATPCARSPHRHRGTALMAGRLLDEPPPPPRRSDPPHPQNKMARAHRVCAAPGPMWRTPGTCGPGWPTCSRRTMLPGGGP